MPISGLVRLVAAASFVMSAGAVSAASVSVDSYAAGYYQNTGATPDVKNIIEDSTRNNWMAFDLSGITGTIIGATLTIFADGNYSASGVTSITYTLYDVTTDIAKLTGRTGGSAAFADLGSGDVYGSATIATPTGFGAMPELTADLSGALDDLNAAVGGLFAIGGNSSLGANQGYLWISSGFKGTPTARLTLDIAPVPVPAALPLLLGAMGGLGLIRRRKA